MIIFYLIYYVMSEENIKKIKQLFYLLNGLFYYAYWIHLMERWYRFNSKALLRHAVKMFLFY